MRIHPGISIVIPVKIGLKKDLLETIAAIQSDLVREVIIIDDGNEEDIESWIYDQIVNPPFRLFVHRNNQNIGPSISRNFGAQISTSEFILFLDADVKLQLGTLEQLHQKALEAPAFICQPFPQSSHTDIFKETIDHNQLLTDPYRDVVGTGELDYLYSFCFLIRRKTFFDCRGFSAFFSITHEDIEFGDRLLQQGHRIFCLESAKVWHDHPFNVADYYRRSQKNGNSFARLADISYKSKYQDYRDLICSHQFELPFEELDKTYRTLQAAGKYDETVYEAITKHFWIAGIRQYYEQPVISLVIPVANQADKLHRTLRSIKRQTFSNFEIHIVHTADIDLGEVKWKGKQTIHIHKQTEGKLAHAMNMAKSAAKGTYFTWVQCGDYIHKNYLRLLVNEFFLDPSTSISFCGYKFFGMSEEVDGWYKRDPENNQADLLIETFTKWNVVGPGFMVKTNSGVAYNEENWLSEDWDFYLRNTLKGRIRYVNQILYHYLDHQDSLSREVGWRAEDTSLLSRDQEIALAKFDAALNDQKVCAGYVIRNEEYFIKESLLSIIETLDEICIIDTGSDDATLDIIATIKSTHPLGHKINLHHRSIYNYNVSRYRNEVAELTACEWIMIVDGDEVWPKDQIEKFVKELKRKEYYQTESVDVFQKRWSSLIEQQTNFVYVGSLIRAYRRNYNFLWRQSETIDFFFGEKRLEYEYSIDISVASAIEKIDRWLSHNNAAIELQSVEYAYRNFDGLLSDKKVELDVYFDHFSRCKGEKYLKDRVHRIHQKFLKTQKYVPFDKTSTFDYEQFIPIKQHQWIQTGVSLLIPHFNNSVGLKNCLDSIQKFSPGIPFEVILVNDNDAISLNKKDFPYPFPLKIINSVKRGGYAQSCNLGIRNARFDHVCLLNDDIQFVSEQWAKIAVEQMATDDKIMVAGPLTNRTGGYPPVQYEEFGTATFEDCPKIAKQIAGRESTLIEKYTVLSGFCYFLKRSVIVELGLLDEKNYPWGYGEENAYTHGILKTGYTGIVINSLFVWHDLGSTFDQVVDINPKVNLAAIKKQNISRVITLNKPKVIAYGRAKNEGLLLEEQLRRMLAFCDEIVIHDTGSTDDTVRIAKSFDRVTVLETNDSVTYNAAWQLNMALQVARSKNPDWLLYFDMDQFYDDIILYEINELIENKDVDIWSFRLYDGRFCSDFNNQQYNLDFIFHTRRLCEPCYRVLPSLYRNRPDLMIAEPNNWSAWSMGDQSSGVSFPAEHCVLPIQYIDKNLEGSFYRRRIAKSIIRHLGNCISYTDLEKKKDFYTNHESHSDYADQWRHYPLELPASKLMNWKEKEGPEVDLGSNLVKYENWDKNPDKRKEYVW